MDLLGVQVRIGGDTGEEAALKARAETSNAVGRQDGGQNGRSAKKTARQNSERQSRRTTSRVEGGSAFAGPRPHHTCINPDGEQRALTTSERRLLLGKTSVGPYG